MHVQILAVTEAIPKPLQSRVHSQKSAPFKLPYLIANTSDWGVIEHIKIFTRISYA